MPQAPPLPDDEIGHILRKAWKEQASIGWNHVAMRLSKQWGEAQSKYYYMNPDLRQKKYLSGLNWTKFMIRALVDLSLAM